MSLTVHVKCHARSQRLTCRPIALSFVLGRSVLSNMADYISYIGKGPQPDAELKHSSAREALPAHELLSRL